MKRASLWQRIQKRLGFRLQVTFPGQWSWRTLGYRRWQNEHLLSIGKFRFDWRIGEQKSW